MTYEERIGKIIDAALAERAQEERETAEFESAWRELRNSVILPQFRETRKAFYAKGGEVDDTPSNGGAELKVVWQGKVYSLKFTPNKATRQVILSSSFRDEEPDEPFSLENLGEDTIRVRIETFVHRLVRGKKSGGIVTFLMNPPGSEGGA